MWLLLGLLRCWSLAVGVVAVQEWPAAAAVVVATSMKLPFTFRADRPPLPSALVALAALVGLIADRKTARAVSRQESDHILESAAAVVLLKPATLVLVTPLLA